MSRPGRIAGGLSPARRRSGARAGPAPPQSPGRSALAVTIDDLPAIPAIGLAAMRRITRGLLGLPEEHQATAVGFVNEERLAPEASARSARRCCGGGSTAGHELGNHTYSHADLQTMRSPPTSAR